MTHSDSVQAPQELVMAIGEECGYVFDFTKLLKSNETIAADPAPTVTPSITGVATIGAAAPNDATIAADLAAGIDVPIAEGKAVEVTLEGLQARRVKLTCTVVTDQGNTRKQHGWLLITA